jgi:hypothetical protein
MNVRKRLGRDPETAKNQASRSSGAKNEAVKREGDKI